MEKPPLVKGQIHLIIDPKRGASARVLSEMAGLSGKLGAVPQDIGYVGQSNRLFGTETVAAALESLARLLALPSPGACADRSLFLAGLENERDTALGSLDVAAQSLFQWAMAVLDTPSLVILNHPMIFDLEHARDRFIDRLWRYHKRYQATVLMADRKGASLVEMADHVFGVKKGTLVRLSKEWIRDSKSKERVMILTDTVRAAVCFEENGVAYRVYGAQRVHLSCGDEDAVILHEKLIAAGVGILASYTREKSWDTLLETWL